MKADLSRDTFHPHHSFARVLMQQGRVLLDADWNEQVSILLYQTRALAADLIGPHGGTGEAFRIDCRDDLKCDFLIRRGRYYVDGILCEILAPEECPAPAAIPPLRYTLQPDYPIVEGDGAELATGMPHLVYLDVWERHLNYLQADHIRELALGGPDTATRAKVVAQVKVVAVDKDTPDGATCGEILRNQIVRPERLARCLRARARVETPSDDPCLVPPQAQYRGAENQLYRVEIHEAGTATGAKGQARFKWSRDNGSVVFGIQSLQGSIATLASLGPDDCRGIAEGHWVEIVDDYSDLRAAPRHLFRVEAVDRVTRKVTLAVPSGVTLPVFDANSTTHPLLRRWDQGSDAIPVREGKWIELEDGVQVWFEQGGDYKAGDHWLIPARTAIADVLWPTGTGLDGTVAPKAMPPNGIAHHYAPLARISLDPAGRVICDEDCRCVFEPLCAAEEVADDGQGEGEVTVNSLTTLVFEQGGVAISDAMREALVANTRAIVAAVKSGTLLRVDLRSLETEKAPEGLALAERRAKAVMSAYVSAGVPSASLSRPEVSAGNAGRPRVETDLVRTRGPARQAKFTLTDVAGIGDASAARLIEAGVRDVPTLAKLDAGRLIAILTPPGGRTVPKARAESILKDARAKVGGS